MRLCKMERFGAFLRFLRFLVRFCAFFRAKMACRKAQICTSSCKNVQKALLCNTPFSYTPFCVSPIETKKKTHHPHGTLNSCMNEAPRGLEVYLPRSHKLLIKKRHPQATSMVLSGSAQADMSDSGALVQGTCIRWSVERILMSKYYKDNLWEYFGLCLLKTCFSPTSERIWKGHSIFLYCRIPEDGPFIVMHRTCLRARINCD